MNPHDSDQHLHHHKKDSQNIAILAYLGPLVFILYFTSGGDPFIKFHIRQGFALFAVEILLWIFTPMISYQMWSLLHLINFATFVLAIIGIINVIQKKEKELPIIGSLSSYFNF